MELRHKRRDIEYFRSRLPDGKPEKIRHDTMENIIAELSAENKIHFKAKGQTNRNITNISPDTEVFMYIKEMIKGRVLETETFKYWIEA